MRNVAAAVLLGLSIFWGMPVHACVVDRYGPYDPTQYPANIIIGGKVVDDGLARDEPFADIKVDEVFVGTYSPTTYHLQSWVGGDGRCSPPGPDLKTGQQVLIYLGDPDGEAMGWILIHRIGSPLPTLRDTTPDYLLARFAREQWFKELPASRLDEHLDLDGLRSIEYRVIETDADLRSLVLTDQAVAERRRQRESEYHYVGGARSVSNPRQWFTPAETRAILGENGEAEVRFTVDPDGKINICRPADDDVDRLVTVKLCLLLRQRAQMVAPVFDEEKTGYFALRRSGD